MYSTEVKIRVRYAETDQMGYVYYGNYPTYYEVARVEALRSLGMKYKDLEANGVMMPALENYSKYLLPARYDEELTVKVSIPDLPKVKITFLYDIYDEEGKLIHQGETKLAFINMETGKPVRMPKEMEEVLAPFYS